MDLYTFFNSAVTAVAGDQDLSAYALAHYSREQQVKTNPPGDGLPGKEGCPLVILHSPAKSASQLSTKVQYGFCAEIFIYEPDQADRAEENVQESEGTEILLAMIEYIKEAVRGISPADFWMGYSVGTDTVTLFPLMSAEVLFDFTEEWTSGGGDPTA